MRPRIYLAVLFGICLVSTLHAESANATSSKIGLSAAVAVDRPNRPHPVAPAAPMPAPAAPAPGPRVIVVPPELAGDLAAAQLHWGVEYPPLCVTATVLHEPPIRNLGALGEATWPTAPVPCVMRIAPDDDLIERCKTVVHEYGHWLGHVHSADTESIMSPLPFWKVVPACEAQGA